MNGIVVSGSGIGLIVFPVLMSYLLNELGFIGTFYILAGISLQGMVCGMLIISPEKALQIQDKMSSPLGCTRKEEEGEVETESQPMVTPVPDASTSADSREDANPEPSINDQQPERQSLVTKSQNDSSAIKLTTNPVTTPASNQTTAERIRTLFKSLVDPDLLRNPSFIIYAVSSCLYFLSFVTPLVFIPDRAISFGISLEQSALLISFLGLANMTGRIVFGFVGDLKTMRDHTDGRLYLFSFSLMVCGFVTIFNFGTAYYLQVLYSAIYGAGLGRKSTVHLELGNRLGLNFNPVPILGLLF